MNLRKIFCTALAAGVIGLYGAREVVADYAHQFTSVEIIQAAKIPKIDNAVSFEAGLKSKAVTLTPDDSEGYGVNIIQAGITNVNVSTVVNGVTDFIVLPAVANVPVGHMIRVASNAGGAYEIRTPASSAEEINGVDCDGTQEYLAVDTEVHVFVKVSDTDDWVAYDIPAAGGVGAATVPD